MRCFVLSAVWMCVVAFVFWNEDSLLRLFHAFDLGDEAKGRIFWLAYMCLSSVSVFLLLVGRLPLLAKSKPFWEQTEIERKHLLLYDPEGILCYLLGGFVGFGLFFNVVLFGVAVYSLWEFCFG